MFLLFDCVPLVCLYVSSWKVGRRCLALPFEVEARLRRNEWSLLVSTVGLFVEGDAEASFWPSSLFF